MENYYGFDHRFCNVRKGNEKGHVERSVEYIRRKAFVDKLDFETLEEANDHLLNKLVILNSKKSQYKEETMEERKDKELEHMLPYKLPMECYQMQEYRVDKSSTFCINTNHYSVPEKLVGEFIKAKMYANKIVVYHKNDVLCEHPRSYQFGQWILQLNHYLYTIKRKPGALAGSVALSQTSDFIQKLYRNHFEGTSNKEFIELLIYCKEHEISHETLSNHCNKLLQQGMKAVSKENLVHMLSSDETHDQPISTPSAESSAITENSIALINQITKNLNTQWTQI